MPDNLLSTNRPLNSAVSSEVLRNVAGALGSLDPMLLNAMGRSSGALAQSLSLAERKLRDFAADSHFMGKMNLAFGTSWDVKAGTELLQRWSRYDFRNLPKIEVRLGSEINGANGAYAAETNTIYIAKDFLTRNANNPKAVVAVLLEEIGHAIDVRINKTDAAGDEGELFSRLVRGERISARELLAIKRENDFATAMINGRSIQIEMAQVNTQALGNRLIQTRLDGTVVSTRTSTDGINWSTWTRASGASRTTPEMTVFNNRIYQAIRGTDNRVNTRSSADGVTWTAWASRSGTTLNTPSMAVINNRLVQSIQGTDKEIYTRVSRDGTNWGNWVKADRKTESAPAIVEFKGRLYQMIRGTGDNKVYARSSTDGVNWTTWRYEMAWTTDSPKMAVFRGYLFETTVGTDKSVWTRYSPDGNDWSGWSERNAPGDPKRLTTSSPAMFVWNNRLYQTIDGTDGKTYTRWSPDGVTFNAWFEGTAMNAQPRIDIDIVLGRKVDFNGDGRTDILRQEKGQWAEDKYLTAEVLLSNGNGTFNKVTLPEDFYLKGDNTNLYMGDFNGDGRTDILRQEKGQWAEDKYLTAEVLLSNGNGTFNKVTLPEEFYLKGDNTNLYMGDFNGDGRTDILRQEKGQWAEDKYLTAEVLLSNGNGTFNKVTLPEEFYLKGDNTNLYMGDFNGDGRTDILRQEKGQWAEDKYLTAEVLLSNGNGTFNKVTLPEDFYLKGDNTNLYMGDFNGDGRTDILRQEKGQWAEDKYLTAEVLLSNGNGTFNKVTLPEDFYLKGDNTNLYMGDFNGDGRTDILRQEKGQWAEDKYLTAEVLLSNGNGTFNKVTLPEDFDLKGDLTNLHMGDFNGDGKTDFLRQEKGAWDDDANNTANIFLSNGNGSFSKIMLPENFDLKGDLTNLYTSSYTTLDAAPLVKPIQQITTPPLFPNPTTSNPLKGFQDPLKGLGIITQKPGGAYSHQDNSYYAIDFGVGIGTPVYAMRAGTVIKIEQSFPDTGGGSENKNRFNTVVIQHDNGYVSRYLHLQQNFNSEIGLKVGQQVQAGQLIAKSGNSGWSSGPHLHVQVDRNDWVTKPFEIEGRFGF